MPTDETLHEWQARYYALVTEKALLERELTAARQQLQKEQSQRQIEYNENVRFLKRETYLREHLADALQLLREELPYEERTSGYHAEEWSARVRALLEKQKEASDGK